MSAPVVAPPAWLAQVRADAISVALLIHSDYRPLHAGTLAWRHGLQHRGSISFYAADLESALSELGVFTHVPVFDGPASGVSDRYTVKYRAERLVSGGSLIVHGLEIARPTRAERYDLSCGGRYTVGVALDDVESGAWRLLSRVGRGVEDATAPLVRRFYDIRSVLTAAERD